VWLLPRTVSLQIITTSGSAVGCTREAEVKDS